MSAPKTITHLLPTGAIILWGGSDMPSGFLLCNGASVSRSDYPDLAAALGETGTTFSLPDYRDRVPQGAGTVSPNVSVAAGIPNIEGCFRHGQASDSYPTTQFLCDGTVATEGPFSVQTREAYTIENGSSLGNMAFGVWFDASKCSSLFGSSSAVQPNAIGAHFIVKT